MDQWQWTRRGGRQLPEIQWGRTVSRRTSDTPQGTQLDGAWKDDLWLATQGLCVRDREMGSQVSGED